MPNHRRAFLILAILVLLALAFMVNGVLTWAQQHGPKR